jgi:hypothetical protein
VRSEDIAYFLLIIGLSLALAARRVATERERD